LSANDQGGCQNWDWTEECLTRADERRRIGRELHDSTSQLLVVLQLQLHRLKEIDDPKAQSLIAEFEATIGEIRRQIRSLNLG
jgi:signal transduction histidine kinase